MLFDEPRAWEARGAQGELTSFRGRGMVGDAWWLEMADGVSLLKGPNMARVGGE